LLKRKRGGPKPGVSGERRGIQKLPELWGKKNTNDEEEKKRGWETKSFAAGGKCRPISKTRTHGFRKTTNKEALYEK